ncbi:MAG: glucokinase [Candidatus Competibacteraceae bacterium]
MAVATPITGDWINSPTAIDRFFDGNRAAGAGLEQLLILNDFTAFALSLPLLGANERRAVSGGAAVAGEPIGLIGAGTGLGVSGLVWSGDRWLPLRTEGGHVTFSLTDGREWAIGQNSAAPTGSAHVSPERLLSGPGVGESPCRTGGTGGAGRQKI